MPSSVTMWGGGMKGGAKGLPGKGIQKKPQYGDVPPAQTLYVNNLNEKINIDELKCCLHEIFSAYGVDN